MAKHAAPARPARSAAGLLAVMAAFAALFVILSPAPAAHAMSSAGQPTSSGGRYPHTCAEPVPGGAVPADLTWVTHVVGCGVDLDAATVDHLIVLRDAGCEGLRAGVPVRRILDVFTAELGSRTEAVTLLTAVSVYCYGG